MHRVENQPQPLSDYNLWRANPPLREAARREGAQWAEATLDDYGGQLGTARMQEQAALANRYPPVLQTHDRYGHRIDRVEFHPAWHDLMTAGVGAGLQAASNRAASRPPVLQSRIGAPLNVRAGTSGRSPPAKNGPRSAGRGCTGRTVR